MPKFHVTRSGKTEPCGATERACPLGEANHYDSFQEAARSAITGRREDVRGMETAKVDTEAVADFARRSHEELHDDGSATVVLPLRWRFSTPDGLNETDHVKIRIGRRQKPSTVWTSLKKADGAVEVPGMGHAVFETRLDDEKMAVADRYFEDLTARLDDKRKVLKALDVGFGVNPARERQETARENARAKASKSKEQDKERGLAIQESSENELVYLASKSITGKSGAEWHVSYLKNTTETYSVSVPVYGKPADALLAKNPSIEADKEALLRAHVYKNRSAVMKYRKDASLDRELRQRLIAFYNDTL